jgi:hypothetical protein
VTQRWSASTTQERHLPAGEVLGQARQGLDVLLQRVVHVHPARRARSRMRITRRRRSSNAQTPPGCVGVAASARSSRAAIAGPSIPGALAPLGRSRPGRATVSRIRRPAIRGPLSAEVEARRNGRSAGVKSRRAPGRQRQELVSVGRVEPRHVGCDGETAPVIGQAHEAPTPLGRQGEARAAVAVPDADGAVETGHHDLSSLGVESAIADPGREVEQADLAAAGVPQAEAAGGRHGDAFAVGGDERAPLPHAPTGTSKRRRPSASITTHAPSPDPP